MPIPADGSLVATAGAGRIGPLLRAIRLGAKSGPLTLQRVVPDVGHAGWLFGPCLLRGLAGLTLAATTSSGVARAPSPLYRAGTSNGNVTDNSLLETGIPDQIRSRWN